MAKILELTLFSVMSWPLMPSPRSSSSRRSSTPEMADEQDWGQYVFSIISTTYHIEYWKSQDWGDSIYFYNYCRPQQHSTLGSRYIYMNSWSNNHLSKGVGFWARSCEAWSVRHRVLKKKKLIINLFQWNIRLDLSDLVVILFHVLIWQNIFSYLYTYKIYFKDHTSNLSREPREYPCKFFLAGVNFYRFNAKNWQFTV